MRYLFAITLLVGALACASAQAAITVSGSDSGCTVSTTGSYTVYSYTGTGSHNFIVSGGSLVCDVLVVGGGGGGTGLGGGGAGGMIDTSQANGSSGIGIGPSSLILSSGTYSVLVGSGGSSAANGVYGGNGGNSSFSGLVAAGGGGGGGPNNTPGKTGGSGGGCGVTGLSTVFTGAPAVLTMGNAGGGGPNATYGSYILLGGGGGGAGGAGGDCALPGTTAGNGGSGKSSSITGTTKWYAGGGGGGQYIGNSSYASGSGGTGGGGGGGAPSANGSAGTSNTGGGGGGAGKEDNAVHGGDGGSGIVVVRYLTASLSGVVDPGAAFVLSSSSGGPAYYSMGSGSLYGLATVPSGSGHWSGDPSLTSGSFGIGGNGTKATLFISPSTAVTGGTVQAFASGTLPTQSQILASYSGSAVIGLTTLSGTAPAILAQSGSGVISPNWYYTSSSGGTATGLQNIVGLTLQATGGTISVPAAANTLNTASLGYSGSGTYNAPTFSGSDVWNPGTPYTWGVTGLLNSSSLTLSSSQLMSLATVHGVTGNNSFGNLASSGSNALGSAYWIQSGGTVHGSANAGMTVSVGTATISGGTLTALNLTGGTMDLTTTGSTAYGTLVTTSTLSSGYWTMNLGSGTANNNVGYSKKFGPGGAYVGTMPVFPQTGMIDAHSGWDQECAMFLPDALYITERRKQR